MADASGARGLTWRAGKAFELRDVDLNVPAGAIYRFLGPNGSGKTSSGRDTAVRAAPLRSSRTPPFGW